MTQLTGYISKYLPLQAILLINQEALPRFLMDLSSGFSKKMGDFIKGGIWESCIY